MRDFRMWALALAALALGVTPARPAEKKIVPEEGAVQVMLLRQKSVQEALNLTADETKKIYEFTDRQWRKAQRAEELSPAEHNKAYDQLTEENQKFLHEILEPDQLKRLDQITLQVAGLLWVTQPGVASALKLTDEQKARARQFQQEARDEMHDALSSETEAGRQKKLQELRANSHERLFELLTDEQEAKWKELIGEPFRGQLSYPSRDESRRGANEK